MKRRELDNYIPPKSYKGLNNYPYTLKHCPGYEGYIPDNLTHEVCKFCGSIHYYH